MPLPAGLARFNRVVTNPVLRPFARRLPWFGVLHHSGRRTGRRYSTPVMAWRDGNEVVIALTYGPDVDWLRNTLDAESSIVMGSKRVHLGPGTMKSGVTKAIPGPIRLPLIALDVDRYVVYPVLMDASS